MAVRILTDSASDLPAEMVKEFGIDVVPLLVYRDNLEYVDGVTLMSIDLLNQMRQGDVYKTAQVPPAFFQEKFLQYAKQGDGCVYVGFSSGLSATFQTAMIIEKEIAQEYPGWDVRLIDSKCASMGQGMVVYKAAQLAKEGKSVAQIAKAVEFHARHMEHIFTVDDLEYLYRGGRVSRAAAIVGGILNIKPVLHVQDGKLVPLEKVRGRNKALRRMVELMGERGTDLVNQTIGISHGDDMDGVDKLMELIKEQYGSSQFVVNTIGCAIGAHSGPGTLAVFFLNANSPL